LKGERNAFAQKTKNRQEQRSYFQAVYNLPAARSICCAEMPKKAAASGLYGLLGIDKSAPRENSLIERNDSG